MSDYKVHYWELGHYVGGSLIGRWFDLDGLTHEEHLQEITDWLEELTEETGELCEEWIVGDVDGIPDRYVGEYSIDPEFFEWLEAAESSELTYDVMEAGASCGIPYDKIADAYIGHYENSEDYVWEYIENCLGDLPDHVIHWLDFDAIWRDISMELYYEDGHLFYAAY